MGRTDMTDTVLRLPKTKNKLQMNYWGVKKKVLERDGGCTTLNGVSTDTWLGW